MKALALALLFVGPSVWAARPAYDLKLNLSLNGKPVSSPRVLVGVGQKALITQDDKTFIEIVAKEGEMGNYKGIMMNFVVGTMDKNGKRTILAQPSILTNENEPAQVVIGGDENGPEQVSLSVTAQRTTF